jgi:hypothetical protein
MEVLDRARSSVAEVKSLNLLPRPDESMGRAYAYAKSADQEIVARQSIVEQAIDDEPLARYVLLHELQHIIFHPGPRKFRIATGNEELRFLAKETSAEWQADYITRAMFMPPEMVHASATPRDLAAIARVPLTEALARFRAVRGNHITKFDGDSVANDASPLSKSQSALEALKRRLWAKLPTIPGEQPAQSRRCGIFRISWSEYGRTTQCGWFLDQGKIVAFFSRS